MRYIITVCLLAVGFTAAPGGDPLPPKLNSEPQDRHSTELLRKDFKSKMELADAVVVARFHSKTKQIASTPIDKTFTIHILHSQFHTLSVLKGTVADDFTLRHLRLEYHSDNPSVAINDVPVCFDFHKGPMVPIKEGGGTAEVMDEPVYFLYLRRLKDKAVKGEMYEVVEVEAFVGPGVYEASKPWMKKYLEPDGKKK